MDPPARVRLTSQSAWRCMPCVLARSNASFFAAQRWTLGRRSDTCPARWKRRSARTSPPLFDELSYYVEPKLIPAWMEHKIIEIVPLPFMRGRTFNNAYVVLDEAQNATMPEIRMFLTRIGLNSRMILVGDLHQTDLPRDQRGAFGACIKALEGMKGVGISALHAEDIIRHPLIGEIEKRLSAQH